MAARKILFACAAVLLLVTRASWAQHHPEFNQKTNHHHPFVDPMQFEPDFTLFDPVAKYDLMDVKPEKRAPYGFFGTYDRMYLAVTRPEARTITGPGDFEHDFAWGDRYDFGYMTEEDQGWSFTYWNMNSPESYDTIFRTRVDIINELPPTAVGIPGLVIPPTVDEDAGEALDFIPTGVNDFQYGYRLYRERDSLNVVDINGFEMNKTWRLKPYQHGGILEPFIGLRHVRLKDLDLDSTYLGPTVAQPDGPVPAIAGDVTESIREVRFLSDNRAFGGQLGFRYFRYENRWTLSTDFRVMAMQNFWRQIGQDTTVISEYGGIGDSPVEWEYVLNDNRVRYHDNDFVVGFDLRAEAAYQVTKAFTLRTGIQIMSLETGIMRGNALAGQNAGGLIYRDPQDIQLFGLTFGATINR